MPESRAPHLEILLFGGPRVRLSTGEIISLQPLPGAVLTLLVLAKGNSRTREELARALWPDEEIEVTRNRLRVALSELRKKLPPGELTITANSQTVRLVRSGGVRIDYEAFEALLREVQNAVSGHDRETLLHRLLSLAEKPFAPGIYVEEVIRARGRAEHALEEVRTSLGVRAPARDLAIPIHSDEIRPAGPSEGRGIPARERTPPRKPLLKYVLAAMLVFAAGWLGIRPRPLTYEEAVKRLTDLRKKNMFELSEVEADPIRREQATLCLAIGDEAAKAACGPDEQVWVARLAAIDDDMRRSFDWLLKNEQGKAVRLAVDLNRFWWVRQQPGEAKRWLDAALPIFSKADQEDRARALVAHAMCQKEASYADKERASELLEGSLREIRQALSLYKSLDDAKGTAEATRCEGVILHNLGHDRQADELLAWAQTRFKDFQDPFGEAQCLVTRSYLHRYGADGAEPACLLGRSEQIKRSVELFRESGNEWSRRYAFDHFSGYMRMLDERPALTKDPRVIAVVNEFLAEAREELRYFQAHNESQEAMTLRRQVARMAMVAGDESTAIEQLGYIIQGLSLPAQGVLATRLAGAYICYLPGCTSPPFTAWIIEQTIRFRFSHAPGPHRSFESLLKEGANMTLGAAIAEAAAPGP